MREPPDQVGFLFVMFAFDRSSVVLLHLAPRGRLLLVGRETDAERAYTQVVVEHYYSIAHITFSLGSATGLTAIRSTACFHCFGKKDEPGLRADSGCRCPNMGGSG